MSSSPNDRLAAAVRLLLGELGPVASLTADTADKLEKTREQLQADIQTLAATIASSTKTASLSALGQSRLSFEAMIDDQESKLRKAGMDVAARIGHQLVGNGRDLISAAADFRDRARTYAAVLAGVALLAGVVGGLVGAWLIVNIGN